MLRRIDEFRDDGQGWVSGRTADPSDDFPCPRVTDREEIQQLHVHRGAGVPVAHAET